VGGIDLVVLHYTGMQDAETALARLTDPAPRAGRYPGPWQARDIDPDLILGRASAHYVIDESGAVFALVDERARAWHAGVSLWEGHSDTNDRAIGIEIVNGGHDFGLPDFADAQIEAVIDLVGTIMARHGLTQDRVVGHSDVAPARKQDPGEKFPWARLAASGVSIWPRDEYGAGAALMPGDVGAGVAAMQKDLQDFGYGLEVTGLFDGTTIDVSGAFKRRFFPHDIATPSFDAPARGALQCLLTQIKTLRGL
jgi:N-acetylmuramoyl-L-alanine amidase